jgi:hypothetical protein
MTKIIVREDCGNSPKNILVQQITIAIAKRDLKFIHDSVAGDIHWNIVGDRLIDGKEDLTEFLKQLKNDRVASLTIHHVASHGKAGAVDGIQKLQYGEMLAFCNVYEFGNTKGTLVSEITSYVISI